MTDVYFFNFSKKNNSTARPDGEGTKISVVLKQGTNYQSPTFVLSYEFGAMLNFNYCKWSGHFYFITSTTSISYNHVEVTCEEDVLATYKDMIANYSCFIERSSKQDPLMVDQMYLPREDWRKDSTIVGEPINVFHNNDLYAFYIVRTVSSEGILLYYMSNETLNDLLDFMWSDGSWGDALSDAFTKLFFDPFKYILSVDWTPIKIDQFLHLDDTVKLGFWDSNVNADLIGGEKSPTVKFTYDLGIQNTRYTLNQFQFYDMRFSRYYAELPFVGVIPIDITKINSNQLTADYYYDAVSGLCDVWLRSGSNDLSHFQTQLNVPIQIGYTTSNPVNQIATGLSTGASIASGNVLGAIQNGIGAIRSTFAPDPSIIGSNASIASILSNKDASQFTYTCGSIAPDANTEGFADCNKRKIGDLSGFIKCRNASINVSGFTGDADKINAFLNSGFYYE